jgi:hypothetical protein
VTDSIAYVAEFRKAYFVTLAEADIYPVIKNRLRLWNLYFLSVANNLSDSGPTQNCHDRAAALQVPTALVIITPRSLLRVNRHFVGAQIASGFTLISCLTLQMEAKCATFWQNDLWKPIAQRGLFCQ